MTNEQKAKISLSNTGKTRSMETKEKLKKCNLGKTMNEDVKKKIRDASLGDKNHNYGKKASEEVRKKLSISRLGSKNHRYGTKTSDQTKLKQSTAKKGIKQTQVTCCHCNKTAGISGMKRYHFDNCKIANDRLANWKQDLERQDKWLNERGVENFETDIKDEAKQQNNQSSLF